VITTRKLSENQMLGTKTFWHHDDTDDSVTLETALDTEPLQLINYEKRKAMTGVQTKMGDGDHHIADLPMHLLYKLKAQGHWEPSDVKGVKLLKWLRDHRTEWMVETRRFV